jgi:hypothetical protein
MAYVSKEDKKTLAPAIKKVLAEYGVKGTIKVNNYSTLVVTLRKVPAGLFTTEEIERGNVNVYWIEDNFTGTAKKFLTKLLDAMKGAKYYNNDDSSYDYFDRSHYTNIDIGEWNKPVEIA